MDSSVRRDEMSKVSKERPIDILLVEDNPGDVRLTREAFDQARVANELHVVRHGDEALDYLHRRDGYEDVDLPDIVLLDLNLPGTNGLDILEQLKNTPELRRLPVIILTSSRAEEDVVQSYEQHANAYLTKPVDPDEFIDLARTIGEFWIQVVELPPV